MTTMTTIITAKPLTRPPHLAIVVSQFNFDVTSKLLAGAQQRLRELSSESAENVCIVQVPGAVEIPLLTQKLAESKKYEAIIALGAVIRGEPSHYDYVCKQ